VIDVHPEPQSLCHAWNRNQPSVPGKRNRDARFEMGDRRWGPERHALDARSQVALGNASSLPGGFTAVALIIAQRFSAGITIAVTNESRRDERTVLPSTAGTSTLGQRQTPALKHWAIFNAIALAGVDHRFHD
jgi:hypothetical protein